VNLDISSGESPAAIGMNAEDPDSLGQRGIRTILRAFDENVRKSGRDVLPVTQSTPIGYYKQIAWRLRRLRGSSCTILVYPFNEACALRTPAGKKGQQRGQEEEVKMAISDQTLRDAQWKIVARVPVDRIIEKLEERSKRNRMT
jgi:hypothetical protein